MSCNIRINADGSRVSLCLADDEPLSFAPCQTGTPAEGVDFYYLEDGGKSVCADHPAVVEAGLNYSEPVATDRLAYHLNLRRAARRLVDHSLTEGKQISAFYEFLDWHADDVPPALKRMARHAMDSVLASDPSDAVRSRIAARYATEADVEWVIPREQSGQMRQALVARIRDERFRSNPLNEELAREAETIVRALGNKIFRGQKDVIEALEMVVGSDGIPNDDVRQAAFSSLFAINPDGDRTLTLLTNTTSRVADDCHLREWMFGTMEYLKTARNNTPVAQEPTERSDLTDAEQGFIPILLRYYDCAAEGRSFWAAVNAFGVVEDYKERLPLHIQIDLFSRIVHTRGNYAWNIVRPLCDAALAHGSFRAARALEDVATNGPDELMRIRARECLARIAEAGQAKK